MVKYVPSRGDVIWIDSTPQKGKEITKARPALVISPQKYNHKTGLILCLPITSKLKGYPFELPIYEDQIKGAVLCDQIRSFDWQTRKVKRICVLDKDQVQSALTKFKLPIQ